MSKLSFVKYHGAGNDFILIDDRASLFIPLVIQESVLAASDSHEICDPSASINLLGLSASTPAAPGPNFGRLLAISRPLNHSRYNPSLIPTLCHRRFGIGADGVILLQSDPAADFRMRIFNCDGSEASSCGNGLRCLVQFIYDLGLSSSKVRIATGDQIVVGERIGSEIAIQMDPASNCVCHRLLDQEVYSLDTGVPHAVVFVPDVLSIDVPKAGASLRRHPHFSPAGTNVNFAALQKDGSLHVRTFERGVESETLSCGTGAVAVAYAASLRFRLPNPIPLHFPGGVLKVSLETDRICLIGEVVKVFEGFF